VVGGKAYTNINDALSELGLYVSEHVYVFGSADHVALFTR